MTEMIADSTLIEVPFQKYQFSVLEAVKDLHDDATGSGESLGPDERVWLRNWLRWLTSDLIWDWPKTDHLIRDYEDHIRQLAWSAIALSERYAP